MKRKMSASNRIWSVVMTIVCVIYLYPIFMVLSNSLKVESAISTGTAFELPNAQTFAGLANYENAIGAQGFLASFFYTTFITVSSVLAILLFCSMFAWYITRVNNLFTKVLYLLCAFSMVVPFQMVMFTLSSMADTLRLNTPWVLWVIYLGFGAGLAVFMFCGFMKSMWIWNDYLLPTLILDIQDYRTIAMLIQFFKGSYGRVEMGPMMACIMLAILPIVVIYLFAQKYIIKGVVAGAVKG